MQTVRRQKDSDACWRCNWHGKFLLCESWEDARLASSATAHDNELHHPAAKVRLQHRYRLGKAENKLHINDWIVNINAATYMNTASMPMWWWWWWVLVRCTSTSILQHPERCCSDEDIKTYNIAIELHASYRYVVRFYILSCILVQLQIATSRSHACTHCFVATSSVSSDPRLGK